MQPYGTGRWRRPVSSRTVHGSDAGPVRRTATLTRPARDWPGGMPGRPLPMPRPAQASAGGHERTVRRARRHPVLGNDALYFQVHLGELASHRMDERDECLRSIRDLRVVLDELVADVLGDGRLRFAEVERRVQEPAGGCLKFFLSRESSLFSFFGVDA